MSASDAVLPTQRLVLRPLAEGDAPALWPYVSDPELPRHMTWEAHRELAQTEAFVSAMAKARAAGTNFVWAMQRDGVLVGLIGLHDVTRTHLAWRMDRAELGYWIGPAHQGQGLVTEAARALLRHAFAELGLHKVIVGCLRENVASRRVIEKLGFRLVGEQRDHAFRDGRWWDHLLFELCADEPAAQSG